MSDQPGRLAGHNLAFVEGLFEQYLESPDSVSPEWQSYFATWAGDTSLRDGVEARAPRDNSIFRPASMSAGGDTGATQSGILQERLDQLVRAYRVRGHMVAQLDPLGFPRSGHPELEPSFYGLRTMTSTSSSQRVTSRDHRSSVCARFSSV